MTDKTIQPCPFCGSQCDELRWDPDDARIFCRQCNYNSRAFGTMQQAIAAHNRVSLAVQAAEKYPRIGSGELWHPLMNLWSEEGMNGGFAIECGVVEWFVEGDCCISEGFGPVTVRDLNGNEWTATLEQCYSTEALAEAALAQEQESNNEA